MDNILSRLDSIERMLADLLAAKDLAQEYYSTTDVAKVLQKAEWTVREWCRLGRVKACKRRSGRGRAKEWMVSHEELKRIKSEGLLPRE
ncbi:MAG: helix-turn-helix domain-containing protein [Pirellulaceae bacterium]